MAFCDLLLLWRGVYYHFVRNTESTGFPIIRTLKSAKSNLPLIKSAGNQIRRKPRGIPTLQHLPPRHPYKISCSYHNPPHLRLIGEKIPSLEDNIAQSWQCVTVIMSSLGASVTTRRPFDVELSPIPPALCRIRFPEDIIRSLAERLLFSLLLNNLNNIIGLDVRVL